ncbi:MAG: 6-carboxytetrahydropterin synthase QueD [Endomicrobiales bacterium]|nr:6-carboxytetrahydropterin synthase QueD [Endomicrobiales bacterium]
MAKYTVSIIRDFSSAHALRGYKGRCEKLHGHNWKVKVSLSSRKLNRLGMVEDFTLMKRKLDGILDRLDHRYINETPPFTKMNPTAENLAFYILGEFKAAVSGPVKVESVEVWESDTSSAKAGS